MFITYLCWSVWFSLDSLRRCIFGEMSSRPSIRWLQVWRHWRYCLASFIWADEAASVKKANFFSLYWLLWCIWLASGSINHSQSICFLLSLHSSPFSRHQASLWFWVPSRSSFLELFYMIQSMVLISRLLRESSWQISSWQSFFSFIRETIKNLLQRLWAWLKVWKKSPNLYRMIWWRRPWRETAPESWILKRVFSIKQHSEKK